MDQLIAAIDNSAAAGRVLVAAKEIGRMFADDVRVLTVCDDGPPDTLRDLASAYDLPLDVKHGDAVEEIARTAADDDVRGVVIGSRALPASSRAVGHTAFALIHQLRKPVVVVPPMSIIEAGRRHRLLVPLDGTGETATAVQTLLQRLLPSAGIDVVALHVFGADDMPVFSDQPGHETDAWRTEFLHRWLPGDRATVKLETRVGRAAEEVRSVAHDVDADVVAVAWEQDLTAERGELIAALLADAELPVVLLPIAA